MKLMSARVTNYRSVEDSTEFSLDQISCLVGKNESGKSNLLQALFKLNPYDAEKGKFNRDEDYPRRHLSEYVKRHGGKEAIVIWTKWELSDEDTKAITDVFGPNALKSREVEISKGYENKQLWTIHVDEAAIVNHLVENAAVTLHKPERDKALKSDSFEALKKDIRDLGAEASERQTALLAALDKIGKGSAAHAAMSRLTDRLPKFILFSSYDNMAGRVQLQDLKKRIADKKLLPGHEVFLSFMGLAGVSVDDIEKLKQFEPFRARFEAASNTITKIIFKYWTQNQHLRVQFIMTEGFSEDETPFNAGQVLRTLIYNEHHEVTVPFDVRSTGFVWFYSFLVYFSQVQNNYKGQVFILLDEPGLSLHGMAQGDLLRYMNEELRPQHQIVYTTHLPFMIDSDNFQAVRTVEDVLIERGGRVVEVQGTKVGEKYALSRDKDTLFPLQGKMGFELSQTLFVGKYNLTVEGMSDLHYLKIFSDHLRSSNGSHLDPKWTICPVGGVDKASSFVSLFHGKGFTSQVVVDVAKGQKQKIENLKAHVAKLHAGHVITLDAITGQEEADIEDVLGRSAYVELVNRCYNLKESDKLPAQRPAGAPTRVIEEVEGHFRTLHGYPEFDHYAPAAYFLEHRPELLKSLPEIDRACERFEKIFLEIGGARSSTSTKKPTASVQAK
jgi:predicted ATPase